MASPAAFFSRGIDLFLVICVIVARFIAANRKAILSQGADLAANISSVKQKQLFKLLAVDGIFFADMIFTVIFADGFLLIHLSLIHI